MKKALFVLSLLLLTVGEILAQKIDSRLTRIAEQSVQRRSQGGPAIDTAAVKKRIFVNFNSDGTLQWMSVIAMMNEGGECPTERLQQMGIEVVHVLGRMVTMRVPADKLQLLEQVEEFTYVMPDEIKDRMNDAARKATGVDDVNNTASAQAQQLPKAYTGKGVVTGIIDGGIDFNHAAFYDAEGNSRVVKVIYVDSKTKKLVEVTDAAEIKKLTSDDIDSHGTHTSAIVCGSDLGNGYQGMAPESEIILCGLGDNAGGSNVNACIEKIFQYADSKNMPAVVNISLGEILGLHDGSDPTALAVEELTKKGTAKGRAVVISASNDASNQQSIIHTFKSADEELKTVLGVKSLPTEEEPKKETKYDASYYFYATDYQDFSAKLKLVDMTTGQFIKMTNNVYEDGKLMTDDFDEIEITKYKGTNLKKEPTVFFNPHLDYKLVNGDHRLVLVVKPGHAGQTVNLICGADGNDEFCFDAPNWDGNDFLQAGYVKGNGDFAFATVVCNPYVISVGSYITKNEWTNYKNKVSKYPKSRVTEKRQEVGEISDFSSYGVADNGIKCPLVLAPGQGLVSGASNYDKSHFQELQPGEPLADKDLDDLYPSVEKWGRKNWYLFTQGTSMSAPVVTGIIALWMQANPELTVNEIINIIKETSDNDEWTTNMEKIPSKNKVQAGCGKINCLKGLQKIVGIDTAIETISADGHREAIPATMYDIDAPVYNLQGRQVDKSYRGLVIYKGRIYLNK